MKKIFLLRSLLAALNLTACQQKFAQPRSNNASRSTTSQHKHPTSQAQVAPKITTHKKYKGFKLATIPVQYQGTWYRGDPYKSCTEIQKLPHLQIHSKLVSLKNSLSWST